MVTLYNVVSADGYIARENGDEDFIPDTVWNDFLDICREHDLFVTGRKTYEAIQKYPRQMIKEFEDLDVKKVVVTDDVHFVSKPMYTIAHSPTEAFTLGANVLVSSGPTLNTSALEDDLIDRVVLNVLPEKIGGGIKVFKSEPNLSLVSEKEMGGGRKWRVYKVVK
ncbi:MAG: dihydrofolate reductase family protein [Candidatus Pacebacteria bacterium]|nr:dihydrofolate reductase family protein [Candidatus Paceibacterota bacterium]